MLEAGVARECARNILPLYTPPRLHANGSVRSWVHYVGLAKEDTQLEHQLIARQIAMILGIELPTIVKQSCKQTIIRWMAGAFYQRFLILFDPVSDCCLFFDKTHQIGKSLIEKLLIFFGQLLNKFINFLIDFVIESSDISKSLQVSLTSFFVNSFTKISYFIVYKMCA